MSYHITLLKTLTLPDCTEGAFNARLYEGTLPVYTAEAMVAGCDFFCGGVGTKSTTAFTTRMYEGTLPENTAEAWVEAFQILWWEEMGGICPIL